MQMKNINLDNGIWKIYAVLLILSESSVSFLYNRLYYILGNQVARFHPSAVGEFIARSYYVKYSFAIATVVLVAICVISLFWSRLHERYILISVASSVFVGESLAFGWSVFPWFKSSVFL